MNDILRPSDKDFYTYEGACLPRIGESFREKVANGVHNLPLSEIVQFPGEKIPASLFFIFFWKFQVIGGIDININMIQMVKCKI